MTSFTQNVLKFKLQAAILGLDHKSRGEKTWMASIVNSPPIKAIGNKKPSDLII
jgi:hypothetical protein